jgi:hypothetical protein
MSRQAEAERERRSLVIIADGELEALQTLARAAEVMNRHPAALQLRLLQTLVEMAAERNSTLVLPFPSSCCVSWNGPPPASPPCRHQQPPRAHPCPSTATETPSADRTDGRSSR